MGEEHQTDYSQAYDFLYRIERRISYLEKDEAFIEKKINVLEDKRFKDFKMLSEDLRNMRTSLSDLKKHLSSCSHAMAALSKELKNTIKKDDVTALAAQVDDIKFEEYVIDTDIDRGI